MRWTRWDTRGGEAPRSCGCRNWDEYDKADCSLDHERGAPRCRRSLSSQTDDIGAVILQATNQRPSQRRLPVRSFIKGADL